MAFFQLNDVFGYQHANAMKRLWAADTAPADPGDGEVWLDTSVTPNRLKRYNGTAWETVGDMTAGELLTLLKTVDGDGSGLDADTLDGKESVEFLQKNSDGSLIDISGTDLNDLDASGLYKGNNLTNNPDDSEPELWGILHTKHTSLFQNQIAWNLQHLTKAVMYMRVMGSGTWGNWYKIWTQYSDGAGSGLDADTLDGQEGSYFQDASNLNAGTLNKDRLPTEVVRKDQSANIAANTEWQDGYEARFGNDADLRVRYTGTDSYIDNHTGNFSIRQLSHGANIYLQAEADSGAMKNLLTLDPDANAVKIGGLLNLGDPIGQDLVIASGEITVTRSFHRVDTEGEAASDYLVTINGGNAGDILILQSQTTARNIILKDNNGNLKLSGDFTLDNSQDKIMLIAMDYTGVGGGFEWHELSRSTNGLP